MRSWLTTLVPFFVCRRGSTWNTALFVTPMNVGSPRMPPIFSVGAIDIAFMPSSRV